MWNTLLHYSNHFIIPFVVLWLFYNKKRAIRLYPYALISMCIDLDHLWANPIFDPNRCSVGFHSFHQWWIIIPVWIILLRTQNMHVLGWALLWHLCTDWIDCQLM